MIFACGPQASARPTKGPPVTVIDYPRCSLAAARQKQQRICPTTPLTPYSPWTLSCPTATLPIPRSRYFCSAPYRDLQSLGKKPAVGARVPRPDGAKSDSRTVACSIAKALNGSRFFTSHGPSRNRRNRSGSARTFSAPGRRSTAGRLRLRRFVNQWDRRLVSGAASAINFLLVRNGTASPCLPHWEFFLERSYCDPGRTPRSRA